MDNNSLATLLENVIDAVNDAMSNTDSFQDECPECLQPLASRLYASLDVCRQQTQELLKNLPAPGGAPRVAIQDAIALLEANGFIVGTKT